jgi:hypothetical protein
MLAALVVLAILTLLLLVPPLLLGLLLRVITPSRPCRLETQIACPSLQPNLIG